MVFWHAHVSLKNPAGAEYQEEDMKSIADFTRELCICPNSNLGGLAVYEVEPISLLFAWIHIHSPTPYLGLQIL